MSSNINRGLHPPKSIHINRAGTEMADKLAREGSAVILCGSESALPLSRCTAQMITKMWADNAHLSYWKSLTNCRQSKLWLVVPKLNVKKNLLRLSRDTLRYLILITGHGKFRKYLHRMVLSDNTLCLACGLEEETAFYFICECKALSIARTFAFVKPLLNESEYKQTTFSQIQGFAARTMRTDVEKI
jgi:hypothetical protein